MALIFASPIPARILSSFLQNTPVHVSGSKNRVYHTAAPFLYAFSALKKNVPWQILAPSVVAYDMFLLRASAPDITKL